MATKTSTKPAAKPSAKGRKVSVKPLISYAKACEAVLKRAGGRALPQRVIADRALDLKLGKGKRVGPSGGITPYPTITALLAVSHNSLGKFERTAPGHYKLRPEAKRAKGAAAAKLAASKAKGAKGKSLVIAASKARKAASKA